MHWVIFFESSLGQCLVKPPSHIPSYSLIPKHRWQVLRLMSKPNHLSGPYLLPGPIFLAVVTWLSRWSLEIHRQSGFLPLGGISLNDVGPTDLHEKFCTATVRVRRPCTR